MYWLIKIIKQFAKLIKILNSENNPNRLSFGFCFGMLLGVPPVLLPQNLIILLVILLFRINLFLTGLAFAIFSGLSFFLGNLADSLGTWILTNTLTSFWGWLYNLPLVSFTRFNNTLVMGSTVMALILFIPLFFICKLIIRNYSKILQKLSQKSKLIKAFYENYTGETNPGMIRWKGVIAFVVLLVLTGFALWLTDDMAAEKIIEEYGSQLVGAKVEVDHAKVSALRVNLDLKGLQVTNPNKAMENLFSANKIKFDFKVLPLFYPSAMATKVNIKGLRFSTKRKTSGALKQTHSKDKSFINKKMKKAINKKVNSLKSEYQKSTFTSLINNIKAGNAKEIIQDLDLQTVKEANALRNDIKKTQAYHNFQLKKFPSNAKLTRLEKEIKSLENTNWKNPAETLRAINKMRKYQKLISRLQKKIAEEQKNYTTSLKQLQNRVDRFKSAVKQDKEKIKKEFPLNEEGLKNLGIKLFGEEIIKHYEQVLMAVTYIRGYMAKKGSGEEQKEIKVVAAPEGKNVIFPVKAIYPGVWCGEVLLQHLDSKNKRDREISGKIKNITDSPMLIKKPLIAELKIDMPAKNIKKGLLKFKWDQYKSYPSADAKVVLNGIQLNNIKLKEEKKFALKLKNGIANINNMIKFEQKTTKIITKLVISEVVLDFKETSSNTYLNLIKQSLSKIGEFSFDIKSTITDDGELTISLSSNLDKILSNTLQKQTGQMLKNKRGKARSLLEQKLANYNRQNNRQMNALKSLSSKYSKKNEIVNHLQKLAYKNLKSLKSKKFPVDLDKAKDKLKSWFD